MTINSQKQLDSTRIYLAKFIQFDIIYLQKQTFRFVKKALRMGKMKTKVVKIALLFISIASTLVAICLLDDVVPVHFNAFGEVDRWGSKYELLVLPLVLFFVQLTELFTRKFLKNRTLLLKIFTVE